jgi:hypothetical protein
MSNENIFEPHLKNVLTETNSNQGFFEIRLVDVLVSTAGTKKTINDD